MKQSTTGDNSAIPEKFRPEGLTRPALGLMVAWIFAAVLPMFGVSYGHTNGVVLAVVLIPWTLAMLALLVFRIPRALGQLRRNAALRTPGNLYSTAIAICMLCIPLALVLLAIVMKN